MSAQHTPGSWVYIDNPSSFAFGHIVDARELIVAKPMRIGADETMVANAQLIAAAPCLLAAGKALLPTNLDLSNPNLADSAIVPLDVSLGELRALAAAIAKATGAA